jgi:hypothetical protein
MIEIFEDTENYLVRIRADLRDRVKKISGRQWDGVRKLWVFPKNSLVFTALNGEFSGDADKFSIGPPAIDAVDHNEKPKGALAGDRNPEAASQERESIDRPVVTALEAIELKIDQVQSMIEHLSLASKATLDDLSFLRETEEARIAEFENEDQDEADAFDEESIEEIVDHNVDRNRSVLDLDIPEDVSLFELALIEFCVRCTGDEPKFKKLVHEVKPLQNAYQFVLRAHERILRQLREVADDSARLSFPELISKIQQDSPIFGDPKEIGLILSTLRTLNSVRNRMAHDVEQIKATEIGVLAMLYLLNLAIVWRPVMRDWVVSE